MKTPITRALSKEYKDLLIALNQIDRTVMRLHCNLEFYKNDVSSCTEYCNVDHDSMKQDISKRVKELLEDLDVLNY